MHAALLSPRERVRAPVLGACGCWRTCFERSCGGRAACFCARGAARMLWRRGGPDVVAYCVGAVEGRDAQSQGAREGPHA